MKQYLHKVFPLAGGDLRMILGLVVCGNFIRRDELLERRAGVEEDRESDVRNISKAGGNRRNILPLSVFLFLLRC